MNALYVLLGTVVAGVFPYFRDKLALQ
jgi:hypothetical protein